MSDLNKIVYAGKKLKEIDTILYETLRDYGGYLDNQHIRVVCKAILKQLDALNKRVHEIFDEACKSPVTGDHDGPWAVKE